MFYLNNALLFSVFINSIAFDVQLLIWKFDEQKLTFSKILQREKLKVGLV